MKKLNLSLITALAISSASVLNASTFQEALQNGKVSGEITLTTEERYFKKDINDYYRDSAYGVGSFALKYETAVWNNLSLTSKTRAYKNIWEKSKTKPTGTGTGDASGRFYEKNGVKQTIDIESLFLEYTPSSNINIKAGRQDLYSDWMNKVHDAVKIEANFENTSIEAIWSIRDGRVYSRDYRPLEKMNENKGVYKLGITQKFNDNISATAYGLIFPDAKEIYGARVNLSYDDTKARFHYAYSDEGKSLDKNSEKDVKSDIIDIMIKTSLFGFSPYLGYTKVSDDLSFPGYTTNEKSRESGEIIVPFEEGDYFYSRGASTIYAGISKVIGDFDATVLYGNTKYYADNTNKKNNVDELTLWLGYKINSDLKSNLGYTYVNEKDTNIGEYNQVNLTFTYSF
ncbi:hypothetical protein AAX26_01178 [Aliarcobacter thereius]|uniref:Opr family porin n=1 Tax=Aliarcobacter thereius TaxID=544718 RepID=UPI000827A51A|nr:Opr family porin [Aliarcobacter thereius]OCL86872.1 hypothetical protein AAX26_01178 [Aliarcobacter thereius]